jgi:hypothetical protein
MVGSWGVWWDKDKRTRDKQKDEKIKRKNKIGRRKNRTKIGREDTGSLQVETLCQERSAELLP